MLKCDPVFSFLVKMIRFPIQHECRMDTGLASNLYIKYFSSHFLLECADICVKLCLPFRDTILQLRFDKITNGAENRRLGSGWFLVGLK